MRFRNIFLKIGRFAFPNRIRIVLFRLGGAKIGKRCNIEWNVVMKLGARLADGVTIREGAFIRHVSIGKNTIIDNGTRLSGSYDHDFTIGEESYMGINNIIDGTGGLSIGNFVHIASPNTAIWSHSSMEQAVSGTIARSDKGRNTKPVKICNKVWIGGNVTVYPGVTINERSAVLPLSVVNKDIPSGHMVGGIPAKKIRKLG